MTLVQTVARNLGTLRRQQGLTQGDLAQKARISVSYVSMLERSARVPPLPTLEALARALRVGPSYLLQELADEKPPRRRKR